MKLINKTLIATLSASLVSIFANLAQAETTGYNQISFSAEAKAEINNDEVQARLSKKAQAKSSKELANQLNKSINQALAIAKKYPSVTITTGQYSTYPRYDKNQKIIGWTGQADVQLKSTDFNASSQLIADLQEILVMDDLTFTVSEKKRDEVEKQLFIQASKAFQEQAKTLSQAWSAKNYRLINVSLNTSGNNYHRPMMAKAMMADALSASSVSEPSFEAGNSTLSVVANGTVELIQ